jgi:hypothetical protein
VRDTVWSLKREGGGPQSAKRVRHDVDRSQAKRIQDIAQEPARMAEWINALIIERVGEPMTREIDDERATLTSERWEDWRPKEATGKTTVNQQERRTSAKLQRLGLAS